MGSADEVLASRVEPPPNECRGTTNEVPCPWNSDESMEVGTSSMEAVQPRMCYDTFDDESLYTDYLESFARITLDLILRSQARLVERLRLDSVDILTSNISYL